MTNKLFPTFLVILLLNSMVLTAHADELPPTLGDISTTTSGTTATSVTTDLTTTSADTSATTTTSTDTASNPDNSISTTEAVTTSATTTAAPTTPTRAFTDFTDVSVNHPNYNAIIVLRYQKVLKGYDDNTFRPDQPLNRVEALKLAFEVSELQLQGVAQASFNDTSADAWYNGYLNRAVFLEIANGYPDGSFKPEKSVNLVEFLKMLELAQKVDLSKVNLNQIPYSDTKPGEWYSKYINYAKIHNLLTPDSKNNVYPAQAVTRAQAAEIIYRFRNVLAQIKNNPTAPTETSTPTTPTTSTDPVVLQKDMALYVSSNYKFAIQYPKLWFYSAIANSTETKPIATYGFGNKDLATNAPLVTLELLANDDSFTPDQVSGNFQYLKVVDGTNVKLSAKVNGSTRIYRLIGPSSYEQLMLSMLMTLTTSIEGMSSYNPAEKTTDTSTSTTTSTTTTTDTTTPADTTPAT